MRTLLMSAAMALALAACQPPAPTSTQNETPPPNEPPAIEACNTVAPDATRLVSVTDAPVGVAASTDLRGGPITPGLYDLTSAQRVGAATGWAGERAVALDVAEEASGGVTLQWAGAQPGGAIDRWSATLTDTPETRLTYTCGRMGAVDADFAATASALELRITDGADGSLHLTFAKRP
ncbi:MAG: hypothetical protein AB7O98_07800 [Hyphomonadaceae bacterium]